MPLRRLPTWSQNGCGRWLLLESLSLTQCSARIVRRLRESGYSAGGIGGVCGSGPLWRLEKMSEVQMLGIARRSDPEQGVRKFATPRARGSAKGGPPGGPILGAAHMDYACAGAVFRPSFFSVAQKMRVSCRSRVKECVAVVELLGKERRPAEKGPTGQCGRDDDSLLHAAARWLDREAAPRWAVGGLGCFAAAAAAVCRTRGRDLRRHSGAALVSYKSSPATKRCSKLQR